MKPTIPAKLPEHLYFFYNSNKKAFDRIVEYTLETIEPLTSEPNYSKKHWFWPVVHKLGLHTDGSLLIDNFSHPWKTIVRNDIKYPPQTLKYLATHGTFRPVPQIPTELRRADSFVYLISTFRPTIDRLEDAARRFKIDGQLIVGVVLAEFLMYMWKIS